LSVVGDLFKVAKFSKNDYWLKTNQYARSMSFIMSGYMRVFATGGDGDKEITQWISAGGSFIT